MVGLIGPDGVGKSSLLALVSGARQIQSGQVEVLGGDIADRHFRASGAAAHCLHAAGAGQESLPDAVGGRERRFLWSPVRSGRRARGAYHELLAATGLSPFRDRPAAKLSGGMKQKLGLCCALIHDPDLLILDEPTTGVDPLSPPVLELIDRIRARRPGMSVLVATAYMEEAERFDWLVAMDDGKVIGTGSPANCGRKPARKASTAPSSSCCRKPKTLAHTAVVHRVTAVAMRTRSPSRPTACRSVLAISRRWIASASKSSAARFSVSARTAAARRPP